MFESVAVAARPQQARLHSAAGPRPWPWSSRARWACCARPSADSLARPPAASPGSASRKRIPIPAGPGIERVGFRAAPPSVLEDDALPGQLRALVLASLLAHLSRLEWKAVTFAQPSVVPRAKPPRLRASRKARSRSGAPSCHRNAAHAREPPGLPFHTLDRCLCDETCALLPVLQSAQSHARRPPVRDAPQEHVPDAEDGHGDAKDRCPAYRATVDTELPDLPASNFHRHAARTYTVHWHWFP